MNTFTEEQLEEFEKAIKVIKTLETKSDFWEKEKINTQKDAIRIEERNASLVMAKDKFEQLFNL